MTDERERRINESLTQIRQTGKIEYVEQLWEDVSPMIRHVALKYWGQSDEAEDFIQDFWADIHRIARGFVFAQNGRAYLNRVANNRAINRYRQQKRAAAHVVFVDYSTIPIACGEEDRALCLAVEQAMLRLSEVERIAVQQTYFEQKTVRQIARELGMSKSQIGRIKLEALEKLKALLA